MGGRPHSRNELFGYRMHSRMKILFLVCSSIYRTIIVNIEITSQKQGWIGGSWRNIQRSFDQLHIKLKLPTSTGHPVFLPLRIKTNLKKILELSSLCAFRK